MPTIVHAGGELHFDITAEQLPWQRDDASIVFHHGVGACGDIWRGWSAALAQRYRLIRMDMRGHGESTIPPSFRWTIGGMVADLHAVISASTNAPIHLVGESIGGTVALAYAIKYPDNVRTLTVCNGAHFGSQLNNLGDWAERMGRDGMSGWSAHMMQQRFHAGAISKAAWQWYEQQQSSADAKAILDAVNVLVGADLSSELGQADMPVLLMHPDASPFIPIPVMADLQAKLANARLQVFAHSKHGLPFSHATQCAGMLAKFLAEHG